ncbi:AbrB/MazE/SpoVT family DNA-binding domain-containing protein [Candidatus Bathyarchaeota archaeon]|nr:AbrB/MazE/SpoVT family DNA-binding domain-containing protein [Candidatus Bathyarchaeota archaeon]
MRFRLKVDSKGHIRLPREVREEVGDIVILEKTENGFVLRPGELVDFLKEFREVIASVPLRTGEPENCPPSRMKTIWRSS